MSVSGCLGGPNAAQGAPGTLDGKPASLHVFDALGNPLDATAFPGELPLFDLVVASKRVSGEPTIAVTRTGAVFFPAIDFDVGHPQYTTLPSTRYMRSLDGGATWEDRSPQMLGTATHHTSFDPYVYADPTTGRVFALDMGPHIACNKVSWSDDDGESWITRDGACIPGANDHPSLFAGPASATTNKALYPNSLYLCVNQVSDSLCYLSPDGGITWAAGTPAFVGYDPTEAELTPADPADGVERGLCGGLAGHGHASWKDGTVYLGRDYCGVPMVAMSQDGGLTWMQHVLSTAPEHDPTEHDVSIGTDAAGNAYAFWVGNRGHAVYLSTSRDQGHTWTAPVNVTAPNVTIAKLPSLVAGFEGRIAFLYVGTEAPRGYGTFNDTCPNDAENRPCYEFPEEVNATTWNAYVGVSLNAHTENPVFATVLANAPDSPLKRGPCGGRCFGDVGGMYDFFDIDIDPRTGQIFAALVDVCSDHCDGPGKGKFTVEEIAYGTVARMVGGTRLLVEPIPER